MPYALFVEYGLQRSISARPVGPSDIARAQSVVENLPAAAPALEQGTHEMAGVAGAVRAGPTDRASARPLQTRDDKALLAAQARAFDDEFDGPPRSDDTGRRNMFKIAARFPPVAGMHAPLAARARPSPVPTIGDVVSIASAKQARTIAAAGRLL